MIFETHGHYDDEKFDEDREELFARFREEGVELVMNIGADMTSSRIPVSWRRNIPLSMRRWGFIQASLRDLPRLTWRSCLQCPALTRLRQ